MPPEGPRADLGRLAADPALADLLADVAERHGVRLLVADRTGAVVAAPGLPAGAERPARVPAEGEAGARVRGVEVYDQPCGSVAAVPIPGDRRAPDPARAAGQAAGLLQAFASREYETENLSQSLLDVYEELNLFYGITARIHAVANVEGICATILDRACEIVRAVRASILLADPRTGILRIVAARGLSPEEAAGVRIEPGQGISGKVMLTNQAVLVDDVGSLAGAEAPRSDARYAGRSYISIPIRVFAPGAVGAAPGDRDARPLGVLNMTDKVGDRAFTSGDLKLLSALASQAAVLLENTRLSGIEKEMGIARQIQASLLPSRPPAVRGAEAAGICVPARDVGGDYYDFVELPGGRLGLLVADVSGHNVGAALMMAVSRASLRAAILRDLPPDEVLATVNALLAGDLARSELFVSVFYAVHDPRRGVLSYANAGHNPPLLLRTGSDETQELDAEGILLGVMDSSAFERREVRFSGGDLALLYTDGLTEARNGAGEEFGVERLATVLASVRGRPVAEIPAALVRAVDRYAAGAAPDDRTAVVLRAGRME